MKINLFNLKNLIVTILLLSIFIISCNTDESATVEIESIKLDESEIQLQIGDSLELLFTYQPTNALSPNVYWTIEDSAIVTINRNNILVAKRTGRSTVSINSSNGLSSNCEVTVIPIAPTGEWVRKANYGNEEGVAGADSFVIEDKAYLVGGSNYQRIQCRTGGDPLDEVIISGGALNSVWEYDITNDQWMQLSDFPGSSGGSVAFSFKNKGYFGLGRSNDFWEYSPETDSWKELTDCPATSPNSSAGFTIDNKFYVVFNNGSEVFANDFWEYSPETDIWKQLANFPGQGRLGAVGFSIQGKGYFGMGLGPFTDGLWRDLYDFWEYDPATDTWNKKKDLLEGVNDIADYGNFGRIGAVGFSIYDRGYVGLGFTTVVFGSQRSDFWEYDPLLNRWREMNNAPIELAVTSATQFTFENRAFVGTGRIQRSCGREGTDIFVIPYLFEFIP